MTTLGDGATYSSVNRVEAQNGAKVSQIEREDEMLNRARAQAKEAGGKEAQLGDGSDESDSRNRLGLHAQS